MIWYTLWAVWFYWLFGFLYVAWPLYCVIRKLARDHNDATIPISVKFSTLIVMPFVWPLFVFGARAVAIEFHEIEE